MMARRSVRLRILLFFALIAIGGAAAIALGLFLSYHDLGDPSTRSAFVQAGLVATVFLAALTAAIWFLFDQNVAKPVERLAADLRARIHAGVAADIDEGPARYLGDLAPAAAAAAASLAESRDALAEAVARETVRVAAENTRLAAILRDVPAGVILCTPAHRIVLYNARAAALLAGSGELGLDRPLTGLLREGPIHHAQELLTRAPAGEAATELLCTTTDGARVLQGQMRLVRDAGDPAATGYVLTLRDVTTELSAHAARERLLHEVVEQTRRPATGIQTSLDVLADPGLPEPQRAQLQAAVAAEAGALAARLAAFGERLDTSDSGWWPMAEVPAADIADALAAALQRQGVRIASTVAPLVLRCDGYALVQLLADAAGAFAGPPCRLGLTIAPEAEGAVIDLAWDGTPPAVDAVEAWLAEPLAGGYAAFTRRDALDSHGTEFWPEATEGGARLRLPIRVAHAETARAAPGPRPEFYDFDLLADETTGIDDERPLAGLKYVVFDTETTGLAASGSDEIVQLAAVRIVNGRLLTGESLDLLVDPERPIPAAATRVHRVTDAMVAGAPSIAEAGRRFHRFCEDAVLVAHNAPFDMAFLRRHEARIGLRFANPVLDTVLLSAIVYGDAAEHSLDALATRLGIVITAEARHTALGDAAATAQVLQKLLPMLAQAGFVTLGQTIRESRRHGRLLAAVD